MTAADIDALVTRLRELDRDDACLQGTPMVPLHRETLREIIAALAALKADAVPCEPTKAMIDAGIHAMAWDESEIEAATKWVRAFWQAMYDAARAEKP